MVGETVGSYRIERELGTGGMGAVYLARHSLLDKLAAVKMLRPSLSAEREAVDRFFTEAKATTAVRHPGIVDVYDFGFHESGSAFLVMELLEGETLGDSLREGGPLPGALVAAIGWQVAGALGAAHERDIIHRDLKPDNVFLIDDPTAAFGVRAKVLDFGIAKLTKPGSVEHTSPGEIIGTPLYMSPEQCRGQSLTGLSDVYSLGCVLYHALAGAPPYVGDDPVELLKAHALAEVPRLSDVAPDVTAGLDEVIAACMRKDASARPDCFELAEVLREIAETADQLGAAGARGPAPTLPEPSDDEIAGATVRSRLLWPAVGIAAAAALAAVVIAVRGGGPSQAPPAPGAVPVTAAPVAVVDAGVVGPADAAPAVVEPAATTADRARDAAPTSVGGPAVTQKKKPPVHKKKKKKKKWGELLPR